MDLTAQGFARIDPLDLALVEAVQDGLPLVPRPYAAIGERLGIPEAQVRSRLQRLLEGGAIRRFGVVVRHRELGYLANAMVVWDVPDARVADVGRLIGQQPFVNLCYRRPRRPPQWPYNLFCMIHGCSRGEVLANLRELIGHCGLADLPYRVLFSRRRFKQRGARYARTATPSPRPCADGFRATAE